MTEWPQIPHSENINQMSLFMAMLHSGNFDWTFLVFEIFELIKLVAKFSKPFKSSLYRWNYAISSILEEDVRRRLRNWSWTHMKKHRQVDNANLHPVTFVQTIYVHVHVR